MTINLRTFSYIIIVFIATITKSRALEFSAGDTISFLGGENMVFMQKEGTLEASITAKFHSLKLKFRDLSWEGDTVYHQSTVSERWRKSAFGSLLDQLKRVQTNVVILQFGTMESFDGLSKLELFLSSYKELIESLQNAHYGIIVLEPGPLRFKPELPHALDAYKAGIKKLVLDLDIPYIVGNPNQALGIEPQDWLVKAVKTKHRLWYEYWRPANWKCLFGDDSKRIFSNAAEGLPSFKDEWNTYVQLVEQAERDIHNNKVPQPKWNPQLTGSSKANVKNELNSFSTLEGFKVNLFADEALGIANPLSVRWDFLGRAYVACSDTYPQVRPGVVPNDKIMRLTDTDEDGKADKAEVFASGLNIPTGMEVGHDGIYVGQNTELLFIDWEGNKKVILSGFGNGDSHQTINSFVWSPGGELWFCQGDGIESRVETPFGVSSLFQAGVFRLRLDELKLDGLLDDFMGPGNPWGIAFNEHSQSFVIDGAGGISFLSPASIPVKRRLRLPRIGNPGGYCGVEYLYSTALPESMRGDFVIGDYKKNQVSRFITKLDGAGYKVEWKEPLLKSKHTNFRPIDVKSGPDGAIYVVDWYNPITCHQDDFYRHPDRDQTHGRIWRVSSRSASASIPKLDELDNRQLILKTNSKDNWTKLKAKQLLKFRGLSRIPRSILKWDDGELLNAAYVYEYLNRPNLILLSRMINSLDYRVRGNAARLIGKWNKQISAHSHPDFVPVDMLLKLSKDSHPQVRMEAILAASELKSHQAIGILTSAVKEPKDRWIEYVSSQAAEFLKPYWASALAQSNINNMGAEVASLLSVSNNKSLRHQIKSVLMESVDEKTVVSLSKALLEIGENEDVSFVMKREPLYPNVIKALSQSSKPELPIENEIITHLFTRSDIESITSIMDLVGAWKLDNHSSTLLSFAQDSNKQTVIRQSALLNLGKIRNKKYTNAIVQIINHQSSLNAIAWSALDALGFLDLASLQMYSLQFVPFLQSQPDFIKFIHLFMTKENGADYFLGFLSQNHKMTSNQINGLRKAWLKSTFSDSRILQELDRMAGYDKNSAKINKDRVDEIIKRANEGNPKVGETIFSGAKAGCSACHQVRGKGGLLGPDLSEAGSVIPHDRLVMEVLWPELQIKDGYNLSSIILNSGEVLQGYVSYSKNSDYTIVNDLTHSEQKSIPNSEVKSVKSLGTLMPPTARNLDENELNDLFAFLMSLGHNN